MAKKSKSASKDDEYRETSGRKYATYSSLTANRGKSKRALKKERKAREHAEYFCLFA